MINNSRVRLVKGKTRGEKRQALEELIAKYMKITGKDRATVMKMVFKTLDALQEEHNFMSDKLKKRWRGFDENKL
jgi:hypothetical protein